MRVVFLSPGPEMPSTRYRITNMIPYLHEAGIKTETIHPPEGGNTLSKGAYVARLVRAAKGADIVYIQAFLRRPWLIRTLQRLCPVVIYDFDDALYTTPPWQESNKSRTKRFQGTLKAVTAAITGCPEQSRYAQQYCDTVFTLPPAVPRERYEHATQRSERGLKIGWIGTPENIRYLADIEDPLSNLLASKEDIQLRIITASDLPVTPFSDRVGEDVEYLIWSQEAEVEMMKGSDIGIRPLRRDAWSESKGYISVTQFMALGRPVVVTPVGMLTDIVDHGQSGFHATSDEEWVDFLSELAENPERRIKMGENSRKAVGENGLWEDQRAEKLISSLRELIKE
jgi:glycosyltransferase involved in cell wall biosynthesis